MKTKPIPPLEITDEPGMGDRFQRDLQRAFTRYRPITPKAKTRPASKCRVHKGKTVR